MTPAPRPAVAPPAPWAFPVPVRTSLDNGLTVLGYDVPGQYVHSARLAIPLPLRCEPRRVEGVGTIMARTLDEGTARHSATDFAQLLERRGVAIGAAVSDAGLTVDLDVSGRHLDYALDLLRQCLTEPAFPETEVARHVKTRLADIAQERVVPAHRAALELVATFYAPDERASRPTAGSAETVGAIERSDVADFHAQFVAPEGATLAIAGDFAGSDPTAAVAAALGRWCSPAGFVAPDAPAEPRLAPDRARIVFLDRPGSVQTELTVAAPGPDRSVAGGWAPYPVIGFVLGGSPSARIDAVLREERGYTYGIRSSFRPRRAGGLFLTSGSVRADATVEALGLLLDLLDGGRDGFGTDEVRAGVDFIARTAPGRYATADAIADEAGTLALDGLSTQFTTKMLHDLAEVTPERMQRAYRRFVDGRWTVVLVGDAGTHAEAVRGLGRGEVSVIPA